MRHRIIVPLVALAVSVAGLAAAQELVAPEQDRDTANQAQQQERTAFRARTDGSQLESKQLDGAIATCLILGNQEEVALAKFAQSRCQNEKCKQFAQKMIQAHQQAASQFEQFAPQEVSLQLGDSRTGQTAARPPGRTIDAQNPQLGAQAGDDMMQQQLVALQKDIAQKCVALTQRELGKHEGDKFDQAYIGQQIGAHIGMLAKLEGSQEHASGELKQIVERQQQTVEQHLQMANQIMQQLDGQSPTARRQSPQQQ